MAKSTGKTGQSNHRLRFDELDRLFHEKARLGILTAVISNDMGLNFIQLKEKCELTDGNLNRHLKVLTDAKILRVKKSGRGRNTNSVYSLTVVGKKAFESYLDALESIVRTAQVAARQGNPTTNIAIVPD